MRHLAPLLPLVLVILALVASPVAGREYSPTTLKQEVEAAQSAAALLAVFKDHLEHAADVDVARLAQDQWKALDERGARAYAESLCQANPVSSKWLYFRGRIASTPLEQIQTGRTLVNQQPDSPWGYRLVVAAYVEHLFPERFDQPFRDTLVAELPRDVQYFHRFRELEPTSSLAQTALFDYHAYSGAWDSAQVVFDTARAAGSSWADTGREMTLAAAHGRFDEILQRTSADIDTFIARGQLDVEERESTIRRLHSGILRDVKAYDALVGYLKSLPGASSDVGILYDLACYTALARRSGEAFDYLEAAVGAGWDDLDQMLTDPDLRSLRGTQRWDDFTARLADAAAAAVSEEEAPSLGDTLSTSAPQWALADTRGDSVRLIDLRGSVVVLDFFATWCGPCRMALPELSQYVHEMMPEGVRVFSIQVMEKPLAKAQLLWESEGYGMTLLKGTDEVQKAYGFQGIPYICVIDKSGTIRVAYPGYQQGLEGDIARHVTRLLHEP